MSDVHAGGCVCGDVRYLVHESPAVGIVCHCKFCQRRLGSAFATLGYVDASSVSITQGALSEYEHRSDESGRWLRMHFCARCGTTVMLTTEARPGKVGIALGTLDDPDWLRLERHVWLNSKRPWVSVPPDVSAYPQGSPGLSASGR